MPSGIPSKPEDEMEMLLAEARRDFLFYVRLCNPKYIISDVHVYLAKLLQGVAEDLAKGKNRRILISTPPRVGKPVWEEELISMGDGSLKKLKDIVVGDFVLTKNKQLSHINFMLLI